MSYSKRFFAYLIGSVLLLGAFVLNIIDDGALVLRGLVDPTQIDTAVWRKVAGIVLPGVLAVFFGWGAYDEQKRGAKQR